MTLQGVPAKCNAKVRFYPFNASLPGPFATAFDSFNESSANPPELLLQKIWAHQRIKRGDLRCDDGRRVRILHPGFWNRGPGPDFLNAVIHFEQDPPEVGDVEIDVVNSGWHGHNHDINPNFGHVLLRVLWESAAPSSSAPPVLALKPVLDAPLPELALWLESPLVASMDLRGRCCAPLASLETSRVLDLIQEASQVRLRRKAFRFHSRARTSGWDQALWEGVFAALGYRHNTWPMLSIAEHLPELIADLTAGEGRRLHLQSRLLGVAGFLQWGPTNRPHDTPSAFQKEDILSPLLLSVGSIPEMRADHSRIFWDYWWRDRDLFSPRILPPQVWRLASTRPANRPERRLALASHWLLRPNFVRMLEEWMVAPHPHPELQLFDQLQPDPDPFWRAHWTLDRAATQGSSAPLLGMSRVGDLAMNVFFPWLWARARAGGNCELQDAVTHRYIAWPPSQDNQVLKLARQRLFGDRPNAIPTTAATQQGILQIVADFCQQSNALCERCQFPRVVKEFEFSQTMPEGAGTKGQQ